MKVERIDHIHIAVKDLKEAAKKFSDIMGSKWVGPIEVNIPEASMITSFDSLGFELLQPTSPDTPLAKFIERRGEGVFSIGLKVSNLDEAIADLEAKGIRIADRFTTPSVKGAITHPKDTYGVMFELVEYEERTPISLANLNRMLDIPSPI